MSAEPSFPGDVGPVNVLLVDDRPDKLLALESILADENHNVVTARSGQEALRWLLQTDFAVILLDVNMPLMDGFQTASLIRGRPRTEKTPIIFLTAVNETGLSQGYSLGAVDYIRMPVEPAVLKAKVRVFVDLYRKREQLRQQEEARRRTLETEHAARLAEASDRLEQETRRNRFFTLAPEMLGIAGFDGVLRQVNQSWERTLGLSAAELCAGPIADFLHPEDQAALAAHFHDLSKGVPTARFDSRFRHRDGSYRWLSWNAAAFQEEGLVYVFARDITFRRIAEEERVALVREQEARLAAERENEIKDQFLATLSHELRAPLTPILGWTSIMRSGQADPADTGRALEVIERNVRLQAQLIEDLLDVSRIVSGKLRMEPRQLELGSVVAAGLESVRPAAQAKNVTIRLQRGEEPVPMVADFQRLQQVVWNLVSNAVKFTPEGGVVEVELGRLGDLARLRVRDEGIGISPEFLPHVFDRFRQAATGTTRGHGGLGLGLTIVRHLVEAHGGSVVAESEGAGKGARFTVTLPCAAEAGEGAAPAGSARREAPAGPERGRLSGVRVLVVDDEEDVRDLLRVTLACEGAQVKTAGSVNEALAALEAERPDVVVSDIGMPVADGYMLIQTLRARAPEQGGDVPAIALTAYASPEDAARSRAAGFQMHLAKPLDPGRLVETVAALARGRPGAL
jgi:PAS domain S-box-containing protein